MNNLFLTFYILLLLDKYEILVVFNTIRIQAYPSQILIQTSSAQATEYI